MKEIRFARGIRGDFDVNKIFAIVVEEVTKLWMTRG